MEFGRIIPDDEVHRLIKVRIAVIRSSKAIEKPHEMDIPFAELFNLTA